MCGLVGMLVLVVVRVVVRVWGAVVIMVRVVGGDGGFTVAGLLVFTAFADAG